MFTYHRLDSCYDSVHKTALRDNISLFGFMEPNLTFVLFLTTLTVKIMAKDESLTQVLLLRTGIECQIRVWLLERRHSYMCLANSLN